jgi:hypothetical protein
MALFLRALLLLLIVSLCTGQFGINKQTEEAAEQADDPLTEQEIDELGNLINEAKEKVDEALLTKLTEHTEGDLEEQELINLAYMIQIVKEDPETKILLEEMQGGSGREIFESVLEDGDDKLSEKDIVMTMALALDELYNIDALFENPEQAVELMNEEGMIDPEKLELYRKDPELLEEDTRKSYYFTFVSLGAAGGYL